MDIHILLAGVQIGPFSAEQVRQYLAEGLLSLIDPARYEGDPNWDTVERILAHPPAPVVPPPEEIRPAPPELKAKPAPLPEPKAAPVLSPIAAPLNSPVTLDVPLTISPPELLDNPVYSTAALKTKRKPGKIVIQQILPLDVPPPVEKKEPDSRPPPKAAAPVVAAVAPAVPAQKNSPSPVAHAAPPKMPALKSRVSSRIYPSAKRLEKPPAEVKGPPPLPQTRPRLSKQAAWKKKLRIEGKDPLILSIAGSALLLTAIVIGVLCFSLFNRKAAVAPAPVKLVNSPTPSVNPSPFVSVADPITADEFAARGSSRQSKGDFTGALSDYNEALSLDSDNTLAYYHRGLLRQAKANWVDALADFNQVLRLNPRDAAALSSRAFVEQSQGDFDGAIADYTQAIFIDPKIGIAYFNRGLIKEQRGDLDGAISDYDHALDLDPHMAVTYYNRANAKNAEGNVDGAIADYTQALDLNPKIDLAYSNRGFARQAKGDMEGALADYGHAIAINPQLTAAYYNRGLLEEQRGDLNGAIADSTRALELNPKEAQSYCNRGLARLGQGDLDGALTDLKTFCQIAPRDPDADAARLYLWLIDTEENPQGHADQDLADALQNDWNSTPEDLATKIAQYLLDHLSESDLIAAAESSDTIQDEAQHCKVWYFIGMRRLLRGDKISAVEDFRKAIATGKTDVCEYFFAQARLKMLGTQ